MYVHSRCFHTMVRLPGLNRSLIAPPCPRWIVFTLYLCLNRGAFAQSKQQLLSNDNAGEGGKMHSMFLNLLVLVLKRQHITCIYLLLMYWKCSKNAEADFCRRGAEMRYTFSVSGKWELVLILSVFVYLFIYLFI